MHPSIHATPRAPERDVRHRLPRWAVRLVVCLIATASVGVASPASGQVIDREFKFKAIYLYKFGTYTKWPKAVFRKANSPFVIGILGPDPVGKFLTTVAMEKKIDGRTIEIRHYKNAANIRECQILFMSKALDRKTQQAAIKRLAGKNILMVGETATFLNDGGVVNFMIRNNRICIHIKRAAYKREGLEISAQLLRISTVE
jgi:hypothetical protein